MADVTSGHFCTVSFTGHEVDVFRSIVRKLTLHTGLTRVRFTPEEEALLAELRKDLQTDESG